jgi:hypothetical protein
VIQFEMHLIEKHMSCSEFLLHCEHGVSVNVRCNDPYAEIQCFDSVGRLNDARRISYEHLFKWIPCLRAAGVSVRLHDNALIAFMQMSIPLDDLEKLDSLGYHVMADDFQEHAYKISDDYIPWLQKKMWWRQGIAQRPFDESGFISFLQASSVKMICAFGHSYYKVHPWEVEYLNILLARFKGLDLRDIVDSFRRLKVGLALDARSVYLLLPDDFLYLVKWNYSMGSSALNQKSYIPALKRYSGSLAKFPASYKAMQYCMNDPHSYVAVNRGDLLLLFYEIPGASEFRLLADSLVGFGDITLEWLYKQHVPFEMIFRAYGKDPERRLRNVCPKSVYAETTRVIRDEMLHVYRLCFVHGFYDVRLDILSYLY